MSNALPRTGRAAILVAQREALVVDDVALPSDLGYGQILVRVAYTSICGSQLGEIDGVKGVDRYLPHLLGHEGSGEVLAVGPEVSRVRAGQSVVLHWMKGAGIEARPARYEWRDQPLNAGWVTTFNQYAVVSENRVTPLPASFDVSLAPLLGCAITTGLGVVNNNARVKIGESVVVFGVGGVGLNAVQGAALAGGHPIVAVDLFQDRLALARRLGASATVDAGTEDVNAAIRRAIGSEFVDVVVETTGKPEVIRTAYDLTAPHGRTVLVGVPRHDQHVQLHTLALHFGKVLTGSHGGESNPTVDIPRYVRLHDAGKLDLEPLITERYTLDEINHAIDRMRSGALAGRCLVSLHD